MAFCKETSKFLEQKMQEAVKSEWSCPVPSFLDEPVTQAIEIMASAEDTLKDFVSLKAPSVSSMLLGRKTDICLW